MLGQQRHGPLLYLGGVATCDEGYIGVQLTLHWHFKKTSRKFTMNV